MQQTFEGLIKTISYDQKELIEGILQLHSPWGIDLDPTYGAGGFYLGIREPQYRFDINPVFPYVEKADCRRLPLARASIRSIMFDPPFFAGGGSDGIMNSKYSSVPTMGDLYSLYTDALREFYRILKPSGRLIFKCQDSVVGRANHFVHVWVMYEAEIVGFHTIDLFIKLNKSAPVSPNQTGRQYFARKLHSYFWVFRKPGRRTWELS